MSTPHTRGIAAHGALEHLDGFRRGTAARAWAMIPTASAEAIRTCPPMGWLSIEHEHWVTTSVFEVLGHDDGIAYFRWLVARHMIHTPLLSSLLDKATRLFGTDPGTFMRMAPMGWSLVFRDFGAPRFVARGAQTAALEIVDCAPAVWEYPRYIDSWVGTMAATFDLSHVQGTVEVERDRHGGRLRFDLRW